MAQKYSFRTLSAALTAVLSSAFLGLQAETVYKTAWIQDFEDVATYADNLMEGSPASTVPGTSESTPEELTYKVHEGHYEYVDSGTIGCQISQEERTTYPGSSSKFLQATMRGKTSCNLMFIMPSEAVLATDYLVEFDHYLGPSFSNGSNARTNGLAIVGANGVLAQFGRSPVSDKGPYDVTVYRGDMVDSVLSTAIRTGSRGTSDVAAYWIHITVRGTSDGVYLSARNADGAGFDEIKLQDEFDVVKALYIRNAANQFKHCASLDDVVVSLPATESTYTWTGAAADGLWSTPGNWTDSSGAIPLATPTELDDVVIPENAGEVFISADAVYKSLTVGTGSRLGILVSGVTEETDVFEIPTLKDGSKLSADQIVLCGPYAEGVSADGAFITATRVPSVFTWGVSEGVWRLASNWKVNGRVSGDVPGPSDRIVFASSTSFTVDVSSLSVSNVVIDSGAVVTVSGNKNLYARAFEGAGMIRLADGHIGNFPGSHTTLDVDVDIPENFTGEFVVGNGGGYQIMFSGRLSGAGSCRVNENKANSAGLVMSGDSSDFSGSFEVYQALGTALRSNTRFMKASATSSNAVWKLVGNSSANIFQESHKTYYFGALNGSVWEQSSFSGIVLEIGARNVDCEFSGNLSRGDDSDHRNYGTKVVKVGTARLTLDTQANGSIEINDGELLLSHETALPNVSAYGDYWMQFGGGTLVVTNAIDASALIKNSESAISVSNDVDLVWASALAASNAGGFIKKGAGTLTLEAMPQYLGATRIEDGKIAMTASTGVFNCRDLTVVVADPAQAFIDGTVFLEAPSLANVRLAVMESSAADKDDYKLSSKDVGNGRRGVYVAKAHGFAVILR